MTRWTFLIAFPLFAGTAASARAQESPVDSLALARQYTSWLYLGQVDSLVAHTAEDSRGELSQTYPQLGQLIAQRAGFELEVSEETWKLRNGECQYWRTAQFSVMDEPILIRWVLDREGRITGLGAGPYSQAPPVESETCGTPSG